MLVVVLVLSSLLFLLLLLKLCASCAGYVGVGIDVGYCGKLCASFVLVIVVSYVLLLVQVCLR